MAAAMDAINMNGLGSCMDILTQRVVAIQQANKKGGSWEKAEQVELTSGVGSNSSTLAGGLLRLTA